MLAPAIISQLVWIPYRYYTAEDAKRLMARLRVAPAGYEGRARNAVSYWRKSNASAMVGLPVDFGINEIARLGVAEELIAEDLSEGYPAIFPNKPTPRNQGQAEFFENMINAMRDNYTVLATAPTGTGKTVAVLNAVATLGRTTLIIVDNKVIADQWRDEIVKHLGMLPEEIGRVRGKDCVYYGKRITIAIIHNLVQKNFPQEFYRYFGVVAWDEGQILGAESFSQSMGLFYAKHRITVTATPKRRDGCSQMIYDFFGQPRVTAQQKPLPCEIRVLEYPGRRYSGKLPNAILINQLTLDETRNRLIVSVILQEWSAGRAFLCVSDRIEHLQFLMEWCVSSGIPKAETGLFTRSYTDEAGKEKTNEKDYLDWCKREAKVIFATYQMFEKAVDVPRLSAGIDATPRAAAIQLIGRIRRVSPGKPSPRWWTIKDTNCNKLVLTYKGRLRDYATDPEITVITTPNN